MLEEFPVHVVAAWMGHDAKVCLKHYAQTTDAHFDRAARGVKKRRTGGAKAGAADNGRQSQGAEVIARRVGGGRGSCVPVRHAARCCTIV